MTETKARAGEAMPSAQTPAAEAKAAMTGFLNEFNRFQDDVKSTLKHQEERLTMLNAKTMAYGRPALSARAEVEAPHQKAFNAYLRSGDDDGLRGLTLEGKAMSTAVAADGGYLVDPQTSERIQSLLLSTSSLRSIANVVQVEATSFDVIVDRSEVGSGWATEAAATTESATPVIERISIKLHELAAMPKASQRLLDDSAFDVEGWLAEKIATRFTRAEAAAFINGDGVDKPKGILLPTKVADATWTWGNIGYIPTGAAADFAAGAAAAPASDIIPSRPPGATLSPSLAVISERTPEAGAGTSTETLSVSSSSKTSSALTVSPAFFSHLPTVASATDSPRVGTRISVAIFYLDLCQ